MMMMMMMTTTTRSWNGTKTATRKNRCPISYTVDCDKWHHLSSRTMCNARISSNWIMAHMRDCITEPGYYDETNNWKSANLHLISEKFVDSDPSLMRYIGRACQQSIARIRIAVRSLCHTAHNNMKYGFNYVSGANFRAISAQYTPCFYLNECRKPRARTCNFSRIATVFCRSTHTSRSC